MRQHTLFTKGKREHGKDEVSVNAQLLSRAGFIDKLMAGTYSFLPLGLRVIRNIEQIIREEMKTLEAHEVQLPALHPKELWEKTDRWKYKEMFKLKNRAGKDFALGWTHEEVMVHVMGQFIRSYRDLPRSAFQIQTKFRDELRVKSGLLRGVEFLMNDLYSFHMSEQDLQAYFERVKDSYARIFASCGIGEKTYLTLASGGTFSRYSYEFQTETPAGEDTVYMCPSCGQGVNKEIIEDMKHTCPECKKELQEKKTCIEVGNIFMQGTKFTEPFGLTVQDKDGAQKEVYTGAYGIGLGRLMGTIVELSHDAQGIIWPKRVAPFPVHLLALSEKDEVRREADRLYENLQKEGIEVLYDDRTDAGNGEKLMEADLIGIPLRVLVSEKTLAQGSVEVKERQKDSLDLVPSAKAVETIRARLQ